MMVIFLSGEIPRDDLSHVEMQMEVRNKLYWSILDPLTLSSILSTQKCIKNHSPQHSPSQQSLWKLWPQERLKY